MKTYPFPQTFGFVAGGRYMVVRTRGLSSRLETQRGLSMSLEVTRTMKEKRHRGVMSHRIYQVDEV
ncbi:MAG: hypothetical protein L0Z50_25785, partial [Verrucomicrobiales bacterium]|nr:hypothetical protein [Verrucomicrobiales bacterium]